MSSYKAIIVEKKDNVMKITLNRPKVLNAINEDIILELNSALNEAEKDADVKVVVITGAGDRAFSAGADISRFLEIKTPADAKEFLRESIEKVILHIEKLGKPVIAAVNGLALGGGCEIAMACDIIIASEKALFGQPEINVGVLPGWGGMSKLAKIVGIHKAKELALTGDMITAAEAERLGLVNKVVPPEKLEATVMEMANKLKSKSPLAIKLVKEAINRGFAPDMELALERDVDLFAVMAVSEDAKEGVKAFLEKRKPEFKGR